MSPQGMFRDSGDTSAPSLGMILRLEFAFADKAFSRPVIVHAITEVGYRPPNRRSRPRLMPPPDGRSSR